MNYVPDSTMAEMFWTGESRLNRWRYFKRNVVLALFYGIIYGILHATLGVNVAVDTKAVGLDFNFNYDLIWETAPEYLIALAILQVAFAVFSYKLDVRRLKDLGKDNKLAIVVLVCFIMSDIHPIISMVGAFIGIYLLLAKGNEGENEYGPDPLEGSR